MSDSYTKLFSSITTSTVASEPLATRWVWITLLAAVRRDGCVYASIPGLARLANVTVEEVEAALTRFKLPDDYSRSQEFEGRRIADVDGGWKLLNFAKYDAMRSEIERAEYKRNWDRTHRPSGQARSGTPRQSDSSPTESDIPTTATPTPTPTPTPHKSITEAEASVVPSKRGTPVCPQAEIVAMYHELLPSLVRVRDWTESRQSILRKRWSEKPERQCLTWWRDFLTYVSASDFLMGRKAGRGGEPFECDLEWLIRPKNFVKVIEGKYENRKCAA